MNKINKKARDGKGLSKDEMEKLTKFLQKFEWQTERETGVSMISGGFAIAEVFNYDDEVIDVELKFGVQSDCENHVTTEQYQLDRKTMEFIN